MKKGREFKKRCLKLVCLSIPLREYQTPEVNRLFRLTLRMSMGFNEYKNEIPTKNDEDYRVVDNPDEISNVSILIDVIKVADFIERIGVLR